jgi:putative ABC transport system substrate-binding protein
MRRRTFVTLLGGAAVWPIASQAQPAHGTFRIGVLSPFSPADAAIWHRAFQVGLRDLGWMLGTNIDIAYRYAGGDTARLPELAADLVQLKVDIIVAEVTGASLAAKRATTTLPIVIVAVGDPVESGLVGSLARPGGNVTGLSQDVLELVGKRLEMLKAVVPNLTDVAVLWNPDERGSMLAWREVQMPGQQLNIRLHSAEARGAGDLDKAFAAAQSARAGALYIMPSPLFISGSRQIAEFAAKQRMASIFHLSEFARIGGLLTYGPDRADLFRRAAAYVDKILKGAKPGELPVEQPNKYELVLNLKTANALGITIPQSILAQADEVIE